MHMEKNRRLEKLRRLVEAENGPAKFARKYEGVDPTYVSQLLNGHRSFGEKAARKMEERLGLPQGEFDREDDSALQPPAWPFKTIAFSRLMALSEPERIRVEGVLEGAISAIEIEKRTSVQLQAPRGAAAR